MTLQEVLIYALMQYGIQDDPGKQLEEKIPEKCPQIIKELKDIPQSDIYTQYARVLEREDFMGKSEIQLWTYTSFVKYERWKEKGRSHDGRRMKIKMVVYDFDLKKVKTKVWTT